MNAASRHVINAPDAISEDFNGEIVILNLANGRYFSLRGVASPIWSLLLAGHAPQAILESLGHERPELVEEASAMIGQLITLDLLRPGSDAPLVQPIDEDWSGDGPGIEIFDDLAELIYADPIHDVDEQVGWPAPRPA